MFLFIRMAVYFALPLGAAYGVGTWDEASGNLTIVLNAETVTTFLVTTVGGYLATFAAGRVAKRNGGAT